MSDNTKIEWADATVNYLNGCSVISAGCTNCYAMKLAGTRLQHHPSRLGLTTPSKAGPVWNGTTRAWEPALLQPLAWKRPRRIFWNAHGDLFHESVPDVVIDRQFAVMGETPQHTHMVLTKRPERMREYLAARSAAKPIMVAIGDGTLGQHPFNNEQKPPLNVWLGTSVEDQRAADERIPHLLATPAAVRFLSCEPLLGPVDLEPYLSDAWQSEDAALPKLGNLDWIIAGGESGPGARPMHPEWARFLRDQCAAAGVAFHFKQWGEWGLALPKPSETPGNYAMATAPPYTAMHPALVVRLDYFPRQFALFGGAKVMERVGKKIAGRLLDGRTHDEFPGGAANV